MAQFKRPNWVPKLEGPQRILVAGASGGIGKALVSMLRESSDCVIGAHAANSVIPEEAVGLIPLRRKLTTAEDCNALVADFVKRTGGIDGLVVLVGGITRSCHWKDLSPEEWREDLTLNLDIPFFLACASMPHMEQSRNGGRILLFSTESALHGGSPTSLPYAVAKRGIECLVQGLAREGADHNITVNGIRLGFIASGFHERWQGKDRESIAKRVEMVPLKRAGTPEEVAALTVYLLSDWASFITGQMFAITGGDWL